MPFTFDFPGDLLLWIDGRPSAEMSPEEVSAELPEAQRGPARPGRSETSAVWTEPGAAENPLRRGTRPLRLCFVFGKPSCPSAVRSKTQVVFFPCAFHRRLGRHASKAAWIAESIPSEAVDDGTV